jgi:hypothetical protein
MEVRTEGHAHRSRITLKLFASLTKYLPDTYRRSREMPIEIDPGATSTRSSRRSACRRHS